MSAEAVNIPREFDRYQRTLELLEAARDAPVRHYPPPEDRWHFPPEEWEERTTGGVLVVPNGPWNVSEYPQRAERAVVDGIQLDPANPSDISPATKAIWREEFDLVTDQGLPVHPMARLGITTEIWHGEPPQLYKLGMATGIGREYYYGPLKIANLTIARKVGKGALEYLTVVSRNRIKFPGGYAGRGESVAAAAIREASEETGIVNACEVAGIPWELIERSPDELWRLTPSITGPCTLNAWLEEYFLMIDATDVDMSRVVPLIGDPKEIAWAGWKTVHELLQDGKAGLIGAHKRALRAHVAAIALSPGAGQ